VKNKQIIFFSEGVSFQLRNKKKLRDWITATVFNEKKEPGNINYVFCDDEYLYKLNVQYLNHDTFTDIITFDNSESNKEITGDIFISIDRVKDNSKKYKVPFYNELYRVIIHGVLHLIGYKDKTSQEAELMRKKEDYYLSLLPKFIS